MKQATQFIPPDASVAQAFDALVAMVESAYGDDAALFAVDADQTVVGFSAGAEALLGFRREDVVGQHCRKSNRCQTCMVGCGLREHGSVDRVPLTLYRDDGSSVAVRKTARAFTTADGRFAGGIELLVKDTATAAPAPQRPSLPVLDDAIDPLVQRGGILTRDRGMRRLIEVAENVAKTDVTVLLRGESGTGKELFAHLVHNASNRASGPFLAVNCAAITPSLLESELFGHEKGAFTGAVATHPGFFERADGGTLFLDEVGELPLDVQSKLLRVLETRSFFRVGGKKATKVDVRVVSATHRALREEVKAGRFREDLMYRLRVVPLFLPALRERAGDIPLLVDNFLERLNESAARHHGRRVERVAPDAMRALLEWSYPGNVRELKNIIEYAFAVGLGPVIARADLPPELRDGARAATTLPIAPPLLAAQREEAPPPAPQKPSRAARPPRGRPKQPIDPNERDRILRALARTNGDVGEAAALLGMSRATFWRKRQALQVDA